MRVYVIARGYQGTEIDAAEAARQFAAWLTDDANPVLSELIMRWLWQPPDAGGLGSLAESAWDVALLRAEVVARCQAGRHRRPAEGQAQR